MKRVVALLTALALSACGGQAAAGKPKVAPIAPTAAPTPTLTPAVDHQPQRLVIDAIGVNADVEALGVVLASPRPKGAPAALEMAVPSKPVNVGWYALGASPGNPSGAVTFDGHLDWPVNGHDAPAVFWKLSSLAVGATVKVVTVDGLTFSYRVASSKPVAAGTNMPELFSKSGPAALYLITCTGKWDGTQYAQRQVVKADPVPN